MKRFGTVTAMNLFLVAMIIILIFLDEEGAVDEMVPQLGPSDDVKFLNIKVNTWSKNYISIYNFLFICIFNTIF